MRAVIILGAVLASSAGFAQAGGFGGGHGGGGHNGGGHGGNYNSAVAGASAQAHSSAFATSTAGGQSSFRNGGFTRFGSGAQAWGFDHGGGSHMGYRPGDRGQTYGHGGRYAEVGDGNHGYGRQGYDRGYGHYGYGRSANGRYGYDAGLGLGAGSALGLYARAYGDPYGGYAGEEGFGEGDYGDAGYGYEQPYSQSEGYADNGYDQSRGNAPSLAMGPYGVSGEGVYAYGYDGYAETPDLNLPQQSYPGYSSYGYTAYPACGC